MPTMIETEDRLRRTLHSVASSVQDSGEVTHDTTEAGLIAPPATRAGGRFGRRRNPVLAFAAGFIAVVLFGAIGLLAGGTEPSGRLDQPGDLASSPDPTASAEESTPVSAEPSTEATATAEFWAQTLAHWVDTVSRTDKFGPDAPEPEARVIESLETADPFGSGGSMMATVVTASDQMTIRAEYVGRGSPIDENALQSEMAEMISDRTSELVDTIWHAPDGNSESVQADYFFTELGPGLTRVTVLTVLSRLEVDVETSDPALSFTLNQHLGIATGMTGTSLDLTWNPDHPLSTEVEPLSEPAADDWLALDADIWVAWVDEGESDRLWVKTDVQDPSPAPSTDTRSIYAFPGDDLVVIVVGDPVPDVVTVTWDDGSTESIQPTRNNDLDMGFARFDIGGREVASVEGP